MRQERMTGSLHDICLPTCTHVGRRLRGCLIQQTQVLLGQTRGQMLLDQAALAMAAAARKPSASPSSRSSTRSACVASLWPPACAHCPPRSWCYVPYSAAT